MCREHENFAVLQTYPEMVRRDRNEKVGLSRSLKIRAELDSIFSVMTGFEFFFWYFLRIFFFCIKYLKRGYRLKFLSGFSSVLSQFYIYSKFLIIGSILINIKNIVLI